jgi:hypothetical protein
MGIPPILRSKEPRTLSAAEVCVYSFGKIDGYSSHFAEQRTAHTERSRSVRGSLLRKINLFLPLPLKYAPIIQ